MFADNQKEEEEEEVPIHGDLLEVVLSHLPLVDLAPACYVSRSWNDAVFSSLANLSEVKPWLLVHTQGIMSSRGRTVHAYDPRSSAWVKIDSPAMKFKADLRSSSSNFLYALSSRKLSFSLDPLHVSWRQVDAPRVWRVDPIVAVVGSRIIVAGGGSEYEDDPLAVEVYDMESGGWVTCQSMPVILKNIAAPTWLSVAANEKTMFVTEKSSGVTYTFSPDTKTWEGLFDLRADSGVFFSTAGFAGDDMILAGLIGHFQDVQGASLWKVNLETMGCELIGEMPSEFVEKLKGENSNLSSISILSAKDFVYVYNSSDPEELVFCEFSGHGGCRWGAVRNILWTDARRVTETMVFSCGRVEIADLQGAMKSFNRKFVVKPIA
ncbi:hypothetical protein Nepgr_027946 [Nepenthes gracilis]|uniref:F-box domain-containing protein n=1 Tax=Nepenthes gracilis TaxID=150966 RepID=A0AAD3T9R8_NEPGR|nr:hypothetical protein Nepgr_027946 [Nepenthes gracilis]